MPGFDEASAKRIADTVRRMEQIPVNNLPSSTGPRLVQPDRNAVVTTAISARSGTTKGFGYVTIYVDTGDGSGAMRVLDSGVKVWNIYNMSIAIGKWGVVGVVDGLNQFFGADC